MNNSDIQDVKYIKKTKLRSIKIYLKKTVKERWLAEEACLIVDFLPSLLKI